MFESRKAIAEEFGKNPKWAGEILDWAKVDSIDKMSNEEIAEVMKILPTPGGEK